MSKMSPLSLPLLPSVVQLKRQLRAEYGSLTRMSFVSQVKLDQTGIFCHFKKKKKKKRASFQTSCFCIPGQNGIHSYLGMHLTALYQFPGKLISVTLTEIINQTDYYLVCLQKSYVFEDKLTKY